MPRRRNARVSPGAENASQSTTGIPFLSDPATQRAWEGATPHALALAAAAIHESGRDIQSAVNLHLTALGRLIRVEATKIAIMIARQLYTVNRIGSPAHAEYRARLSGKVAQVVANESVIRYSLHRLRQFRAIAASPEFVGSLADSVMAELERMGISANAEIPLPALTQQQLISLGWAPPGGAMLNTTATTNAAAIMETMSFGSNMTGANTTTGVSQWVSVSRNTR